MAGKWKERRRVMMKRLILSSRAFPERDLDNTAINSATRVTSVLFCNQQVSHHSECLVTSTTDNASMG